MTLETVPRYKRTAESFARNSHTGLSGPRAAALARVDAFDDLLRAGSARIAKDVSKPRARAPMSAGTVRSPPSP